MPRFDPTELDSFFAILKNACSGSGLGLNDAERVGKKLFTEEPLKGEGSCVNGLLKKGVGSSSLLSTAKRVMPMTYAAFAAYISLDSMMDTANHMQEHAEVMRGSTKKKGVVEKDIVEMQKMVDDMRGKQLIFLNYCPQYPDHQLRPDARAIRVVLDNVIYINVQSKNIAEGQLERLKEKLSGHKEEKDDKTFQHGLLGAACIGGFLFGGPVGIGGAIATCGSVVYDVVTRTSTRGELLKDIEYFTDLKVSLVALTKTVEAYKSDMDRRVASCIYT